MTAARVVALFLALGVAIQPLPAAAQSHRPLAGRPLADVLRELQQRGLRVVFSSEVVRPGMRVIREPDASDDRRLLDQLLAPHGLEVRSAARGVLLVARGPQPRERRPAAPRTDGSIGGVVVDARSAAPLAGVLVRVPAAGLEILSDRDGHFALAPVPPGPHRLFVALVGYALAEPEVTVTPGVALDLTIALAEGAAAYTEQVEIVGDRFRGAATNTPAAMALNSADLRELRGVLTDDPFRAVQAVPGVMTGNDLRSEFSVRGSDPGHVGLSVDGITTGWPVHSVRGDWGGGSVGLINADVLDSITLQAGAYPQDQPGRSGGWLELTMREGSRLRTQAHAALTMTSASVIAEGPLGRATRGSWLVSARQSFVQWILERAGTDGTTFGFSDVQGKLVFDVTPRQRTELLVLAGRSLLELHRDDPDPNLITRGETTSGLVALAWRSIFDDRVAIVQRLGFSSDNFANDSTARRDLSEGSSEDAIYRADAALPLGTVTIRTGLQAARQSAAGSLTRFIGFLDAARVERVENIDGDRTVFSSYARLSVPFGNRLALDAGALLTSLNGTTVSPHAALTASAGPWTARAASGLYRQLPHIEQAASSFGGEHLQAEWSGHIDVSIERALRGDTRLQLAAYFRDDRDGLRLLDDEYRMRGDEVVVPSLTPRWQATLEGRAYGFELLAQRRSAAGLSGWVAYGWARTTYRDTLNGERFDGDFDQRHSFNAFAQHRLSPVTAFSGKLRIGSSFPIVGYIAGTPDDARLAADRNRARLPLYARLDLRANRAFNLSSRRLTLFVEVVNVLGRDNVAAACACASWADSPAVLSTGRVVRTTQDMFPFLPTAGIVFDF